MKSQSTIFMYTLAAAAAVILVSVKAVPMPLPFEWPDSLIPDIGGGLFSTGRIIAKVCNSDNINDEVAQQYFDCYGQSPFNGKDLFEKCQKSAYGIVVNTADNFKIVCRSVASLPTYVSCIRSEFREAAVDLDKTMEVVNKCQAKVLGIE